MTFKARRVGKKFDIIRQIGSGSFGEIFLGVNSLTGEEVAVKVEDATAKAPQLVREMKVYRSLAGVGTIILNLFSFMGSLATQLESLE